MDGTVYIALRFPVPTLYDRRATDLKLGQATYETRMDQQRNLLAVRENRKKQKLYTYFVIEMTTSRVSHLFPSSVIRNIKRFNKKFWHDI